MAMRSRIGTFIFHLRNRTAGALPRIATGFVVIAAIACALWADVRISEAIVGSFGGEIGTIASPRYDHPVRRAGEVAEQLFQSAVTQRWLVFDAAASSLDLRVDCDALEQGFPQYDRRQLAAAVTVMKDGADPKLAARQLCKSDPGAAIREEVLTWNRGATVVAVRDDRNLNAACKDGTPAEGYVPENCYESAWQGSFAPSSTDAVIAAASAATIIPGPPPDEVRSVLRSDAFGFTPWRRFDVAAVTSGKLVLRSLVKPNGSRGKRRIAVDVIGDLEASDPPVVVVAGTGRSDGPVSIELFCDRARTSANCQAAAQRRGGQRMPRGVRLTFEFEAARPVEIRIAVKPIIAVPRKVAALEKARFITPDYDWEYDDDRVIKLTDRVQVRCRWVDPSVIAEDPLDDDDLTMAPAEGAGPVRELDLCGLYWHAAPPPQPQRPGSQPSSAIATAAAPQAAIAPAVAAFAQPGLLSVRLSAPEPLVLTKVFDVPDPTGLRPSVSRVASNDVARQLALVPVVGIDDKDADSLLGQLRGRVPTGGQRDIELTIDARLQRATFELLKGLMGRAAPFAEIDQYLESRFDKQRRGSIVLIDAGASGPGGSGFDKDTGRILAAASWPELDSRTSEEDIRTFAQVRPWESPLAARGWSGNDKYNAPGSALKPIIALAAMDRAARGDNAIADFLGAEPGRPGLAPGALRTFGGPAAAPLQFGFTSNALVVPVGNSNKTFKITTESQTICADMMSAKDCSNATGPVNLRHMLARSNNLWFARLALALDADAVMTTDAAGRRMEITDPEAPVSRPLAIARMVSRLWPPEARDIIVGDRVDRYSRVHATAVQLDEANATKARRQSVALNGIGQAAQATPLAMASMFASIATGRVVLPRLTAGNDPRAMLGASLFDPASLDGVALDQSRAEEMLRTLRTALADVVRVGTAAGRFGALTDRVFGKTGTAQVGQNADDPITVWFIGWIEGLKLPGFEQRRIAFACMVTHADQINAAGGRVCAPLMRMLFQRIEGQQQPQPQATQQPSRPRR
jgi:cell division protein FtsI/penicillin-binding protein 2